MNAAGGGVRARPAGVAATTHRERFVGRLLLLASLVLAAVPLTDAQTRFEGEGRVVAINEAKGSVTLDHGPIPGLMSAMRMEFPVRAGALPPGVRVGDLVRFSLQPRDSEWIVATITPAADRPSRPRASIPAPDFTLPTLAGDSVRLSALRGKAILLNFWATWCLPCRAEMAAIEQLYRRHRDRGLEVVAVNLDKLSATGVGAFVKEVGVTFRVVLDPAWATTGPYGVVGLPTTYLIDRAGSVVVREVGERNWADDVSDQAVTRLLQ